MAHPFPWKTACLITALSISRAPGANQPTFTEVSEEVGIDFIQAAPETLAASDDTLLMTGGAAASDFDNDGWVDLYVTRVDAPGILYRNVGGSFVDVTETAFGNQQPAAGLNGPAFGDIDNDGHPDLFVTTMNGSRFHLYHNQGDGTFREIARERGVAMETGANRFGTSATFGDFNRDGFLDLVASEWHNGTPIDDGLRGANTVFRNRGAAAPGYFEDITETFSPHSGLHGFSPRFSDLDRDGWPDLAIAGDFGDAKLFWNNRDGTFTDGTEAAGIGTGTNEMGADIGDIDGDGDLDWLTTSIGPLEGGVDPQGNRLFRNDGGRKFSDITTEAGVRAGGWGWGAAMFDFDNDGDLDIAQTNGMFFDQPSRFWENDGNGQFTQIAEQVGIAQPNNGRALLTLDFDNDGDLDLFIMNNGGRPLLFRNDGGNAGDYLQVTLEGTISNRQAIGAFLTVIPDLNQPHRQLVDELDAGSHFLGQSQLLAHFGLTDLLGTNGLVDRLIIDWPSGRTQQWDALTPNQRIHLVEIPEPASGLLLLTMLGAAAHARPRRTWGPHRATLDRN